MNHKHLLLCLSFVFGLLSALSAQQKGISNQFLIKKYQFYRNTSTELTPDRYFGMMADQMYLAADSKMVLEESIDGQHGVKHHRYRQVHQGVPVFGSTYILHEKDGKVTHATGRYTPQISVSVKPGIDEATAIALAKKAMKANRYNDKLVTATLMLVDPAFPEISENTRLAYQIDLVSTDPANKHRYFVDAQAGKILCDFPLILQHGVPSTAQTKYYGVQNIISDSIAPQEFILRDPTRGGGIFIYHDNGDDFTNNSSNWNLTNVAMDEVALDAHYCTQEYYDLMLDAFDWEGQDGQGQALKVRVHVGGPGFVNAYWDGEYSNYGDGDCNYGPLTTLEVVGHEFTHGMIDFTSQLVYDGESGAINECMADIFGKYLEYKTAPAHHDWALGHSFIINPDSKPFRQMDDPGSLGMPAMYNGQNWDSENGVHTNSALGNLWYTMIIDGRQGVNEAGVAYQVASLGFDKAAQIAFLTNRAYLTESSDYNAFYQYSVAAAEELYGAGSVEVNAVKEAWKAVGLPSAPLNEFDLAVQGEDGWDNTVCGIGGFVPVKVKVINKSTTPYDPSQGASVTLSSFSANQNFTIQLTEPIGPGETYTIEVQNWLESNSAGTIFVDITLDVSDNNFLNNFSSGYYNILEYEYDDLSLFTFPLDPDCFAESIEMAFFINNNSCNPLPAGTEMSVSIKNEQGAQIWSAPYVNQNDIPAGTTVYTTYTIPIFTGLLTFTLTHANDPNLLNNEYTDQTSSFYLPIVGNYINDFELNNGQDNYLDLAFVGGAGTIYPFQNSQFFGSTGSESDENLVERCPDPLSAFNQSYSTSINAGIKACVDMTGSPNPGLSFDLAMFRNNVAAAEGFQYSSMLQAKWEGNQTGQEIFYGQPEGFVESKNIPLPANFKGSITLRFYTEIGNWVLEPSSLANDDVLLLDNFRLSTVVSTNNPKEQPVIQMFPNPAQDQVRIQTELDMSQIQLQDMQGRTLRSISVQNNLYDLQLNDLAKGIYFVTINMENGAQVTQKLVRM